MIRRFVLLAALVVIGVATWRVGSMLSNDARGTAVAMVFGALAGLPAAVLVLAVGRHHAEPDERYDSAPATPTNYDPPGLADIERALEPYRRADERLEQEAIQRDLEEGIDYPVGQWRQHRQIEVSNG